MTGFIEVTFEERPKGGKRGQVRMGSHPRLCNVEVAKRSKNRLNMKIFTDELTTRKTSPSQAFLSASLFPYPSYQCFCWQGCW